MPLQGLEKATKDDLLIKGIKWAILAERNEGGRRRNQKEKEHRKGFLMIYR